jgi:plastocyanin
MRKASLGICVALGLLVDACGSDSPASTDASTPSTVDGNEVDVQGYVFPAITTAPGATITLVDLDDEPHTVTADDGSFKAGPFDPKKPAQLVAPATPGSYPFHCEIHPTMHGTLVVQNS